MRFTQQLQCVVQNVGNQFWKRAGYINNATLSPNTGATVHGYNLVPFIVKR